MCNFGSISRTNIRSRSIFKLFVILCVFRLAVALLLCRILEAPFDNTLYLQLARNLADGYGFVGVPNGDSILWRTPGYPAVLSLVMLIFGKENFLAIICFQSLIDSCVGLVLVWIGKNLGSVSVGVLGAVLYVLYPLGAYYTLRGQPESLFALAFVAVVACVWFISIQKSQPPIRLFVVLGCLVGFATLIKAVGLLLLPVCVFILLIYGKVHVFKKIVPGLCVLLGFCIIAAPWTIRNYLVSGDFIPVATGGGYSLWVGYNRISDGREEGELQEPVLAKYIAAREAVASPFRVGEEERSVPPGYMRPVHISPDLDAAFKDVAVKEIISDIPGALILVVKKMGRLWFSIFRTTNQWAQIYVYFLQVPILLFALIGVMSLWRRNVKTAGLWLPILGLTFFYGLIVSTLRYSMPLMSVVLLFSAQGVVIVFPSLFARIGIYPVESSQ